MIDSLQLMHVEGLNNRLEAIASPDIIKSFNNNDVEKIVQFVQLFETMGRSNKLLHYYKKCLLNQILQVT